MNEGPTLQFLVPFYGPPELLKLAVLSILAQSDGHWTALVVDDGYPDSDIRAWVTSLDDERISYEQNSRNLGANGNYRRALDLAHGDYVVFMGADDLLLPQYVEVVRRHLRHGPTIVQPGVTVIDGSGRSYRPPGDLMKHALRPSGQPLVRGEDAVTRLMIGNWTYFPSLAWHRETITTIGFRPFHVVQDLALIVDVLHGGGSMQIVDELCFAYRRHSASDSSVKSLDVTRFSEERDYFRAISSEFAGSWTRAARWARLRPTSRMNALATVPRAIRRGRISPARRLMSHAMLP